MQRFNNIINLLSNIGCYASAVCIIFMILMISVSVFARRILGSPIVFSDEVCGYLLLFTVFLGLAYTLKAGGHVRVDLLLGKFSGKAKTVLEKVLILIGILFTLIFLTGNFLLFKQFYVNHSISTMHLQLPLTIPGVFLIVGSLLLLFQLIALLYSSGKENIKD